MRMDKKKENNNMANKTNDKKSKKQNYAQILDVNDDKINILLLGTSGCGKSTLINSLLDREEADTGFGDSVTKEIKIYENEILPFRMIDTVGYEYGLLKQNAIKRDISKFSKEGVKNKEVEKLIHMIWFCIDGTAKRTSQSVLNYIKSVTNDWKNVPIIVVLTKSYSDFDTNENIKMVDKAINSYNAKHSKRQLNYKCSIPVVAKEYPVNETTIISQKGLDVLVNKTVDLIPLAKNISESSIKNIDLKLKRRSAESINTVSTLSATAIGAIPIPIPDATVLVPIQSFMLSSIAKIYKVDDDNSTNEIVNTILKVGATTMAGKALINKLKSIPFLNSAASVLNATVAGLITFVAGEVSINLFERIYKGEIEPSNVDWEKEITNLFNKYMPAIVESTRKYLEKSDGNLDIKQISKIVTDIINIIKKDKK